MKKTVWLLIFVCAALMSAQVSVTPGGVVNGVSSLTMFSPKTVVASASFAAATLAAQGCQTQTVTVTGATVGANWVDPVPSGSPTTNAAQAGLVNAVAWVSNANTVTVTRCNGNGLNTLAVAAITYELVMW